MNVKVEIALTVSPKEKHKKEMYYASEYLTNDKNSIVITTTTKNTIIAEFTIDKARQIDVVDRIGKEFSNNISDDNDSSISFPKKITIKENQINIERKKDYSSKQGKYLSFIYYYTKLNKIPPSEADMQKYFGVSPPSVHRMILELEKKGFIERIPNKSRSLKLLLNRQEIPDLE